MHARDQSPADRLPEGYFLGKMAARAYSITRAEIEGFWRRKEMEEEEQRVAAEKEGARVKAKTLKIEDYMLFEQMIREILGEGLEGDMARRTAGGATKNSTETRIGIKHWWRRSSYAYLNEPAATTAPTDENGRSKHVTAYIPQDRCMQGRRAQCGEVWWPPYLCPAQQPSTALASAISQQLFWSNC